MREYPATGRGGPVISNELEMPGPSSSLMQELKQNIPIYAPRTAAGWISLAISPSSFFDRRRSLAYWLMGNGFWRPLKYERCAGFPAKLRPVFPSQIVQEETDKMIRQIKAGKLDPLVSVNRAIEYLKEQNKASSTIRTVRSNMIRFLRFSRLGIDPSDIDVAVQKVKREYVQAYRLPTVDQIRAFMLAAPLKTKVLVSMLISTGARIGEIRRVRKEDLDLTRRPAYVYIRKTKNRRQRIAFLSSESVDLIQHFLKVRKYDHEHLFDGYDQRKNHDAKLPLDRPLAHTSAWHSIRRVLDRLQMNDRNEAGHYVYHPHVFRVLTLAMLKAEGYPPDWAEYYVGHSIGTATHYIPPTETLAKEWLKLESRFCFLRPPAHYRKERAPFTDPDNPALVQPQTIPAPSTADPCRTATYRWDSANYHFVKTHIESVDYDQALAEGYSIFDLSEKGLRVLRKSIPARVKAKRGRWKLWADEISLRESRQPVNHRPIAPPSTIGHQRQ